MKLLFSVAGFLFLLFLLLLRAIAVLTGIYSTKFVMNSYSRLLVKKGKYIRRDGVAQLL